MTVSSPTSKAQYNGDGGTIVFSTGFRFELNSDVVVVLRNAAGVDEAWVEATQYTLTGAGKTFDGTLTVSITPTDYTPATGETLTITREPPETQETDYPPGGSFPAESTEDALDKATYLIQTHSEELARTISAPVTDTAVDFELPSSADRASKIFQFDAAGNPLMVSVTSSDANVNNLAALTALEVGLFSVVYIQGRTSLNDGGAGTFVFVSGDQSANVTADPASGVWAAPDSDNTGASGAWQRVVEGDVYRSGMFGIVWDGVTDTSQAVEDAIAYVGSVGGEILFPGGLGIFDAIPWVSNVTLRGVNQSTIMKSPDGASQLFFNPDRTAVPPVQVENIKLFDIIFDGNTSSYTGVAGVSVVGLDPCRNILIDRCDFRNGSGYGLAFQSHPSFTTSGAIGAVENVHIRHSRFHDNGDGGTDAIEFDGLDVKDCDNFVLDECEAFDNFVDGFDFRGRGIALNNCLGHDNGLSSTLTGSGVQINANVGNSGSSDMVVNGGKYYSNDGAGVYLAAGSGGVDPCTVFVNNVQAYTNTGTIGVGVYVSNSGTTGIFTINGGYCYGNTRDGIEITQAHDVITINGAICNDNTRSGLSVAATKVRVTGLIAEGNTRYGYEESSGSSDNILDGAGELEGNTIGPILLGTNLRTVIGHGVGDFSPGVDDVIASAQDITLPFAATVVAITGTTTISGITLTYRGDIKTINAAAAFTLTHLGGGGLANLRLVGGANVAMTNRDVVVLLCNGVEWRQVSALLALP